MNHFRRVFDLFVLLCLACTVSAQAQPKESRVALVIGNSNYKTAPLRNPVNDAKDMAAKLRSLGFVVIERSNLGIRQIGSTLREFRSKLAPGGVALVFYAGHGLQIKGENYLPAVDADIASEEDVPNQSLAIRQIMDVLADAKTRLNLVFLDACRNNPYSRSFRSAEEGLSRVTAPSGTLISFATRPGSVAADGDGRNGLYTGALLQQMNNTGQPIEQVLKSVVTSVKVSSKNRQEPWMEGSIEGEFCFGDCNSAASASNAFSDDRALWESVKDSRDANELKVYLAQFPNGIFSALVSARIQALEKGGDSTAVSDTDPKVHPGQVIKDCPECPELVVIPAGSFQMGSGAAEQALANAAGLPATVTSRENPQHSVNIKSFAAGKYAVTKGEFANFVRAKGYQTEAEKGVGCLVGREKYKSYNWRNVGFAQSNDHPVVCVSWNDAQAYVQWISQASGKTYRLLSEAEREYATRAGTQTAFWWGDGINTSQATYSSYNASAKGEYRLATVPVSSFSPNPFGLYNMHGNVFEWVEDCFHDTYSGAPTDGSAWTTGCSADVRVLRGGSWNVDPAFLRSANRSRGTPIIRNYSDGFRLARSL